MARMVHRHVMTGEEAGAARRRRPVGLAESMWPIGWLFGAAATAWLTVNLRGLLEPGALAPPQWGDDALLILRTLGDAAIVALPAGLILRMPGARRRNPWLLRGLVLLALVQLAQPGLGLLHSWLFDTLSDVQADSMDTFMLVSSLLGVAIGVLSIAGAWAVSDGLSDAGARPRRAVVIAFAAAGAALWFATFLPIPISDASGLLAGGPVGLATTGLWSVALVMDLVSIALRYTIAARLLAGWVSELEPRRAWAMGGTAAILLMIVPIGSTLVLRVGMPADPSGVVAVLAIGGAGEWVGLLLAFAMGLGRGTARRVAERRVVPQYELGTAGG